MSSTTQSTRRRGWCTFPIRITPPALCSPPNRCGALSTDCEAVGAYLLADEVYLGAEIHCPRTPSFWGMSDRVIVTSGLSKAYGIPGVRIGWIVGPREVVAQTWSQHDYITIGPNKISRCGGPRGGAGGESRKALRANPNHPAAKPAHHARVGRELWRIPHLSRTASRARYAWYDTHPPRQAIHYASAFARIGVCW